MSFCEHGMDDEGTCVQCMAEQHKAEGEMKPLTREVVEAMPHVYRTQVLALLDRCEAAERADATYAATVSAEADALRERAELAEVLLAGITRQRDAFDKERDAALAQVAALREALLQMMAQVVARNTTGALTDEYLAAASAYENSERAAAAHDARTRKEARHAALEEAAGYFETPPTIKLNDSGDLGTRQRERVANALRNMAAAPGPEGE